jgi:molecular chaperone GrpE
MFNRNKQSERPDAPDPTPPEGAADVGGAGVGGEREALLAQIEALKGERDEAKSLYLRSLADFQNYQRRSLENEREAKRQGVTGLVLSVVPVIDHFDLALAHNPESMTAGQVVEGVRVIREELLRVLAQHGVTIVNPLPNDELDPNRHHALMQQPAEGVEPGRIARTLQVGYMLGERVIRPANVIVTPNG